MKILTRKHELTLITYIKGLKSEIIRLQKENCALRNDVETLKGMITGGFVDVDYPNKSEGSKTHKSGYVDINDIFSNY